MKPLTKLYLKYALLSGLTFGLINTIWDLIAHQEFFIWKTSFFIIAFGLIFSSMMFSKHKKKLEELGIKEFTEETLNVKQSKIIIADTSIANLIENIKNDPLLRNMKMIINDNTLNLTTGGTWRGSGEKIQITMTDCNNGLNSFSISSKPKLITTIIDYGRNKGNIDRIEKLINSNGA